MQNNAINTENRVSLKELLAQAKENNALVTVNSKLSATKEVNNTTTRLFKDFDSIIETDKVKADDAQGLINLIETDEARVLLFWHDGQNFLDKHEFIRDTKRTRNGEDSTEIPLTSLDEVAEDTKKRIDNCTRKGFSQDKYRGCFRLQTVSIGNNTIMMMLKNETKDNTITNAGTIDV